MEENKIAEVYQLVAPVKLEEHCRVCKGTGRATHTTIHACYGCSGLGVILTEEGGRLIDFLKKHDVFAESTHGHSVV